MNAVINEFCLRRVSAVFENEMIVSGIRDQSRHTRWLMDNAGGFCQFKTQSYAVTDGVWGGLGLIVFTPQASYQYTDTRQTWDQLGMIKFWNDSTSELHLPTRSIFHSRSLFLAFLPSTVRCSAVESLCEVKRLEIYLSFFRAVRGAGHLEQR